MFTIKSERDHILDPLSIVSGIVGRRHTLPILSNILIKKEGGNVTFLSTDLEIEAKTSVTNIGGEGEGAMTVAAKKLQDILRSLNDNVLVSLEFDEQQRLIIRSSRSRFSLQTLPAENFPLMSESIEEKFSLTLQQKTLRQLIGQTQIAMAIQDVRYFLNGMLLTVVDGFLKTVSTDGHRLAHSSIKLDGINDKHYEAILPRKTVLELYRLLNDDESPVEITFSNNQARFSFSNVILTSKLVDGKFPDYHRVIPTNAKNTFVLVRQFLLQALLRVKILTSDRLNGVRLVITENSISINAVNAEQEEAVEELEIDYSGEPLDLGFNINYLLDVLNNVHSDQLEWHLSDPDSSTLIMIPNDENFKYVVMPMRI